MLWGLVCALFATVKTAGGLLAIRFFLGLTEAGFLPGIVYWREYAHLLTPRLILKPKTLQSAAGTHAQYSADVLQSCTQQYLSPALLAVFWRQQSTRSTGPTASRVGSEHPLSSSTFEKHSLTSTTQADFYRRRMHNRRLRARRSGFHVGIPRNC